MIKYPNDYNPIMEYWQQIEKKEIVVCDKLYRTYKKVVKDLDCSGEFFYSNKRGNHIIEFIENYCKHSKGKMGGKPVILELWEKAMLATIFGFVNIEGIRKYQFAELIIGKKNGKSLLSSCVGLYLQVADGEAGPEVYSVATKKDQAKIIWQESKRMVNKSQVLKSRIRTLVAEMDSDFNDGIFKPLASDSDSLDGLNVHCALMDEIHQWKNGKALYDIIADGISAREQPLIFVTTTAGTVREDIYDMKYGEAEMTINGYSDTEGYQDERSIYFIYELDNRSEWTDEKCWQKANPGLGTIKNIRTLKEKVEKAIKNPLLVKNLVCKEFNIRETSSESWLTFDQANNKAKFDIAELKPRYGIGGADLSSTTDLTCATILFKVPGKEEIFAMQMYFLPEDLLEKRVQEDKIPYDLWRDAGLLKTTPGNKIHHKYVTEWFLEIQNTYDIYVYGGGYDAWSATYWVEEMNNTFGQDVWEPVIQGKKTLSGPMKNLGADLENNIINYNNNPILKWCLTNTAIDVDKNDNIQPIKTSNPRRRIDGLASLLDAYVQYEKVKDNYESVI